MNLFERLQQAPQLRTVDLALAQVLQRRDPATDARVLAAASLASLAVGLGHAAFDPAQPHSLLPGFEHWPDADAWRAVLAASPWVSQPARTAHADPTRPLVLEHGLLYLRRYREYEQRLATRLHALATTPRDDAGLAGLAPLFDALFPQAHAGDLQARAAALALVQSLLLVTGGPGTGKTTTIARLLLLLLTQARHAGRPPPRIALVAPTGRAAERMAASLQQALPAIRGLPGVDPALCDALPTSASTLHRLLGTIPDSPQFRFNAGHRLPFDVIVVDESSMVDLPLMCKLAEAVADDARLILLGDPDQLPSVEAGDVLAAIAQAAGDDAPLPTELGVLTAMVQPASDCIDASPRTPLTGHRVQLLRGYRQSAALALSPLAAAVRAGDADAAMQLLRDGELAGVHFHEDLTDPLAAGSREPLLAAWRALADGTDPAAALAQAARLRLLTALRDGAQGAGALNARIADALAGTQRERWFHGRLLLVTRNSDRHRLFNGDIGICLRGEDGATVAWFSGDGEGGVRGFHPAALPAHDSAFVTTVHKAQGSEFEQVWLLLPRTDARVLSRELVYTAITRARSELHVCTTEAVLRAALARRVQRVSGLRRRLNDSA